MSQTSAIRVAPSKGAGGENFPVGSWLLPARLRPHVALFYEVVRAADDIADHPGLDADEKITRLAAFDAALAGAGQVPADCAVAARLAADMAMIGVPVAHARNLLAAFKQDATKNRYDDWEDLLGYCRLSANPVGRFLLDLHGEAGAGHAASDALCTALQIINHLQDCQTDYRDLDRVYLPLDLFAAAGIGVEALDRSAAGPAMRRVLDRVLDGVDALVATARPLASTIQHTGMRREASVIVALAEALANELRRRDPLAERVELTAIQKLACIAGGLVRAQFEPAHPPDDPAAAYARMRVQRSGSSFYWAMRLLPKTKREAMYAVYAFCREVDDIADGPGAADTKEKELDAWRGEIDALYEGCPQRMIGQALAEPVARFGLRREEFHEILRGVGMDAGERMRAPETADLELYCSRVAGAVGLLSVRVFGCVDARADDFALAVGEALQLTNILRDVAEDAEEGRLYLPREALESAGVVAREPADVVRDPALPKACAAVAGIARARFADARALLSSMTPDDRTALRPAIVMMTVYSRLLDRLVMGGWRRPERRVRVSRAEKMWIGLRHGVL